MFINDAYLGMVHHNKTIHRRPGRSKREGHLAVMVASMARAMSAIKASPWLFVVDPSHEHDEHVGPLAVDDGRVVLDLGDAAVRDDGARRQAGGMLVIEVPPLSSATICRLASGEHPG